MAFSGQQLDRLIGGGLRVEKLVLAACWVRLATWPGEGMLSSVPPEAERESGGALR